MSLNATNLNTIEMRVAKAMEKAGRPPEEATLIAVSKRQPDERVREVLAQSHTDFGENTVQEAARKWPSFRALYPNSILHMLGPLQTNKARQAIEIFDYIHTLDRAKLAGRLAKLSDSTGKCPKLFIQVNTGNEQQKSGIALESLEDFIKECRGLSLPIIGLMCIPPQHEEPSLHFALLAKLAKRHGLEKLSMGMSGDFESALALGATHIRVGSAIFGARDS